MTGNILDSRDQMQGLTLLSLNQGTQLNNRIGVVDCASERGWLGDGGWLLNWLNWLIWLFGFSSLWQGPSGLRRTPGSPLGTVLA